MRLPRRFPGRASSGTCLWGGFQFGTFGKKFPLELPRTRSPRYGARGRVGRVMRGLRVSDAAKERGQGTSRRADRPKASATAPWLTLRAEGSIIAQQSIDLASVLLGLKTQLPARLTAAGPALMLEDHDEEPALMGSTHSTCSGCCAGPAHTRPAGRSTALAYALATCGGTRRAYPLTRSSRNPLYGKTQVIPGEDIDALVSACHRLSARCRTSDRAGRKRRC
jgi:hypothetical protein